MRLLPLAIPLNLGLTRGIGLPMPALSNRMRSVRPPTSASMVSPSMTRATVA
ncbi:MULTISPECIES: hypothetical protein [Micrococcaceae]|uniref:hypothetical protein n=1 Tax=Micrococcaceae TaxID=1268 RepID=UPI001619683B|nr:MULTISPECIES: hypothetical protein [Micrococcaceae]MBB5750689.1 hypothetical protein [Micrococcus sp. TA1]HRO28980.1 hypothetical protein [Citricoccus sp.]HRO92920.1 hypothetical protein [Citricoccus sp.]